MKKIVSVLLVLLFLLSAVPFAFAEDNGVYVTGSYESKVCQESYDLIYGPVPGVGTGDKITLFVYASVPVHVELDGSTLADLPAGSPSEASFTAGAEGDHTLTFTPQDGEAETLSVFLEDPALGLEAERRMPAGKRERISQGSSPRILI